MGQTATWGISLQTLKDAAALVHHPDGEESSSRAVQEARNLRRVFLTWRRAAEESLTAEDLGTSRLQLKHLLNRHKAAVAVAPRLRLSSVAV